MITFNTENMPALQGSQVVAPDQLKELGANTAAYSIHSGDVIQFNIADESSNPIVYARHIRANDSSSPLAYYVAVTRNGKASWLAIGGLTRRTFDGSYTCPLCEELALEPSFVEMFKNKLADKSIKCTSLEKMQFANFKDGQRLDTPVERMTPIIAWA